MASMAVKEILQKKEILLTVIYHKKLALLGIIGPLVAIGGIVLAIGQSSWFSWGGNALSDLGHPVHSDAANIFNFSLIIGGILLAIFILHIIIKIDRGPVRTIGLSTLLLAMFFLILIGVFNEAYDPLHWQVSVSFFLLLLVSLVILGISFSRDAEYRFYGIFALAACLIGFLSWTIDWGSGIAIPEAISAFPICIWAGLLAVRFYRA